MAQCLPAAHLSYQAPHKSRSLRWFERPDLLQALTQAYTSKEVGDKFHREAPIKFRGGQTKAFDYLSREAARAQGIQPNAEAVHLG